MSFVRTPQKPVLLPFQQENVATNQQNIPMPYMAGQRLIALRWFTPAMDEKKVQVQNGKKG